jgi:hypothetical protein
MNNQDINSVAGENSIAIGSGLKVTKPYELAIGGALSPEIRVIMNPEEHAVVSSLLARANNEEMLEKIRTGKATIDGMDVKADIESGGLRITISGTDYSASGSENG